MKAGYSDIFQCYILALIAYNREVLLDIKIPLDIDVNIFKDCISSM